MRAVSALLLLLALLAYAAFPVASSAVAVHEEAEDEAELEVAAEDEVEVEAEDEAEEEAEEEAETEEEEEEEEAEEESDEEADETEEEVDEEEAVEALVEIEAETQNCPQYCANHPNKKQCMRDCAKGSNAAATAPLQQGDCNSVCAKKQGALKTQCITQCQARAQRKAGNDAKNGCQACNSDPSKVEACCAGKAKSGCELKKAGMIGFRTTTCVPKSATNKSLSRREIEERANGALPALIQKAKEMTKGKAAQSQEKLVQGLVDKFTADNLLRLKWRCLGIYERKQGVVSAVLANSKKVLGAAVGSAIAGPLGKFAGEHLAGILAGVVNWLPYKDAIVKALVDKALKAVGAEGTNKAVDAADPKKLIEQAVEKNWAAIRKRIDPADNGPTDRPPQTGC